MSSSSSSSSLSVGFFVSNPAHKLNKPVKRPNDPKTETTKLLTTSVPNSSLPRYTWLSLVTEQQLTICSCSAIVRMLLMIGMITASRYCMVCGASCLNRLKSAILEAVISTEEFLPIIHGANSSSTAQENSTFESTMAEVAAFGVICGEVSKTNASTSDGRKKLMLCGQRETSASAEGGMSSPIHVELLHLSVDFTPTTRIAENFSKRSLFPVSIQYCQKLGNKNNKFKTATHDMGKLRLGHFSASRLAIITTLSHN